MKVGIDVDGVLSDTVVAIHRKFPGWDTSKGWYGGFTKKKFEEVWKSAKHEANFWLSIPVVQGFNHRLMIKLNSKHDLYFITDRFDTVGGSAARQTMAWVLFQLLAGNTPAGVLIAKKKGPVAAALQLDYFVDDKPENCMDVQVSFPACKTYLCTLPHNLHFNSPLLPRVANFNEFAKVVLEVKG